MNRLRCLPAGAVTPPPWWVAAALLLCSACSDPPVDTGVSGLVDDVRGAVDAGDAGADPDVIESEDVDPCDPGAVDGSVFVPGCDDAVSCENDCDDGDPCTIDSCDEAIGCVHEWTSEVAGCCLEDECTIDGECWENQAPNPDNACEVCSASIDRRAWSSNDDGECDDGDLCTTDDICSDGVCAGVAVVCEARLECTRGSCDDETGECVYRDAGTGTACDDGDPCTFGDRCRLGVCTPRRSIACDDGDPCTADLCDPDLGCVTVPVNGGTCDDGNPCTVEDTCFEGACAGGAPNGCDDGNLCTADFCDPESGCDHRDLSHLCADTNVCTDEVCDPELGCVYPFNTIGCSDEDSCTEFDACSDGVCRGTSIIIDDGNQCTADICDPETGPDHVPIDSPCDDGNPCTVGDQCGSRTCHPGSERLTCDDDNFCTIDDCDPETGCTFVNHEDPCDDDNQCTEFDRCAGGECAGSEISCDDGNSCTIDSCAPETGCDHRVIALPTCRPQITIDTPLRAATIQDTFPPLVNVRGSIVSGAAPLAEVRLNDNIIEFTNTGETETGWTATFNSDFVGVVGANTCTVEVADEMGQTDFRVQSFHWSEEYRNPSAAVPGSGMVTEGLALYLDQYALDDGAVPPPNDFVAIFKAVIDSIDINDFFDSDERLAREAGFNVYLRSVTMGGSEVSLTSINGGIHVTMSLLNIRGGLEFDCTNFGCQLLGGDSNGGFSINRVTVNADLMLEATPSHEIAVTVANSSTNISNLDIWSNNSWTNFLLSIIEPFIIGGLMSSLEDSVDTLGPLLGDAFEALAFNQSFELPRLDGATGPGGEPLSIEVNLESDFHQVLFTDTSVSNAGGRFIMRSRATTPAPILPDIAPYNANLGTPARMGCGFETQELVIPRLLPIEIVFADDTLNQILHAAWRGGLLEFPVDASLFGDVDLDAFGIEILSMDVSALLPPLASDCSLGQLRLYVGDLAIEASMELFDQPMDMVVYVSFDAPIELAGEDGALNITIESIENVELEVNVLQPEMVGSEEVIADLLATELVPSLGELFGSGEPLTSFPLPEIDLSESLDMPPGSLIIAIEIDDDPTIDVRQHGNTIIFGRLL